MLRQVDYATLIIAKRQVSYSRLSDLHVRDCEPTTFPTEKIPGLQYQVIVKKSLRHGFREASTEGITLFNVYWL